MNRVLRGDFEGFGDFDENTKNAMKEQQQAAAATDDTLTLTTLTSSTVSKAVQW